MGRHASARALLSAILVIAGMGMLHAVSPAAISGQAGEPDDQREAVDDIRLAVKLEQSVREASPGEKVEYTATIQNKTGTPQTNLSMEMLIVADGDAMSFVAESMFVRYSEDGPEVPWGTPRSRLGTPLEDLTKFVFPDIAQIVASDQTIQIHWNLQVDECVLRNRWVQVGVAALTDETERRAVADVQTYIMPHTDIMATRHFSATHDVYPGNPAPGETVRHAIRIVNDGYVILDNWLVHVVHDTGSSTFPLVAEDASFYIISKRGGTPARIVSKDGRWWGHPQGGFSLDYLNPGNVLVLQWTEYIAPDVPIGTTVERYFSVETESGPPPQQIAHEFTVSPARSDLSVEIETADPGYLEPTYEAGDLIRMRIIITNRTMTAHSDIRATLDLPSAVSYVNGSGAYATPRFKADNSRRLPDTWIDDGAALPTIEPGDTTTITFKVEVGDNVSPQENLDMYATLRSPSNPDLHAGTQVDVAKEPGIDITLRDEEPVDPGGQVTFNITVRNSGQVPLIGAKFGVEETCSGIDYVPGTLWIESGESVWRDDAAMLQQQAQGDDISIPLGDGDLDPGETFRIDMTFQVAGDLEPGTVAGPQFIVTAKSPDTVLVPWDLGVSQTEIVVAAPAESFVTAEELEAARDAILHQIKSIAQETQAKTDAIDDKTDALDEKTDELSETTDALSETIDALNSSAVEIRDKLFAENPWDQGLGWIVRVGGFAALASFVAGIVLPFTLGQGIARFRERRRRRNNPYFPAPATPPAWRSPGQWRAAAGRASELPVAALRRVRDWVHGLRWR